MASETSERRAYDSYVHVYDSAPKPFFGRYSAIINCCKISVCALTMIASLFLVLAAHQVLPQGVNAISSLGAGGYAIGWGIMGVSILGCFINPKVCFKSKEEEVEVIDDEAPYRNEASLGLTPLSEYSDTELFVTEDRYCLVIDEIVQLLRTQFSLYNPYTRIRLSIEDRNRLMQIPAIVECWEVLLEQQRENASRISEETIAELKALAEGCLNREEILKMSHSFAPHAQPSLDKFASYYGSLQEEERRALDDYWVPQCEREDSRSMKFADLYCSLDQMCMRAVGDQIVLMVLQLQPETRFDVEGVMANLDITLLRERLEETE